jgi:hypothetical protein
MQSGVGAMPLWIASLATMLPKRDGHNVKQGYAGTQMVQINGSMV